MKHDLDSARRWIFARTLLLFFSVAGLNGTGQAQDDPDQYTAHGYVVDQAYDADGTLVQASAHFIAGHFPSNALRVQKSYDRGRTWTLIYDGYVQGIQHIYHLSLDLASGFSNPKADHRVYIGAVGIAFEQQGTVYTAGLVSGSYDAPWTTAELLPVQREYPRAPFVAPSLAEGLQGLHASVAVLPHPDAKPYGVALAYSLPQYELVPSTYRNIEINYSWDLGQHFAHRSLLVAGDDPCSSSKGELTQFALAVNGYGHPSLAYDSNNDVLVLAYDGDFGKKGRSIVVGRVNPVRHTLGKSIFVGSYFGLVSNASTTRKEQHHPRVACADNLIAFTCLTGKPDPGDGSFGLTAFWGSAFYTPWEDAFLEVDDFFWGGRGFHDRAVSAADLSLRRDTLHFTARCIVDPHPKSPGTAILQFRSEMTAPSESSVVAINDRSVDPSYAAPIMAITETPSGQRLETVVYQESNSEFWLDE